MINSSPRSSQYQKKKKQNQTPQRSQAKIPTPPALPKYSPIALSKTSKTPTKKQEPKISDVPPLSPPLSTAEPFRQNPKHLDTNLKDFLTTTKTSFLSLQREITGLKRSISELTETLDLNTHQKTVMEEKHSELRNKMEDIKNVNKKLLLRRESKMKEMDKEKRVLENVIRLHDESVKVFSDKMRMEVLREKREGDQRERQNQMEEAKCRELETQNKKIQEDIAEIDRRCNEYQKLLHQNKLLEEERVSELISHAQQLEGLMNQNQF
jgi:hypothetical protein